jgi:hypothetical protein
MNRSILLIAAALALNAPALQSQTTASGRPAAEATATDATSSRPAVAAVRALEPPTIDGRLDDRAWADAIVASDFVQRAPDAGAPASERTEVRVLYDDHNIYIGARLYDSRPDSIVAPLARRGQNPYSDWFSVGLDTYHDRQSAFVFMVNPRGVKRDLRISSDRVVDADWEGVWDVATRIQPDGWTAEIRIPLSQLRFQVEDGYPAGAANGTVWGVNFSRTLARRDEVSHWAPTPPDAAGTVSRYGELHGLEGLRPPRRLELRPYTVARLTRAPGDPASPFHRANDVGGAVGLDMSYGITPALTLTATVNPDFGQVEADPAVVNLTAFESFFQEKRPFFTEGSEIFEAGWPQLFHSRRIGRAPRGPLPPDATHRQAPEATTILGAAKLTGRVADGWSVGLLSALTAGEHARYVDAEGAERRAPVEPLTAYTVARVTRDFSDGGTVLGGIFTATHRRLDHDPLRLLLPGAAYTGGLDARHRFGGGDYQVTGALQGSWVEGSDSAIARLQRAPARYFQRPDAHHVEYDPTRESLGGYSARAGVQKLGGGNWRWSSDLHVLSPGFEINDLGFGFESDRVYQGNSIRYEQHRAGRVLQNWRLGGGTGGWWSFGGEREDVTITLHGNAQLLNRWSGSAWYMRHWGGHQPSSLRGGPALFYPARHMGTFDVGSDRRKPLHFTAGNYWEIEDATGSHTLTLRSTLSLRTGTRLTTSLRPAVTRTAETAQYVTRRVVDERGYHLLGRLDQTTVSLTGRLDFTLTPTLSLELYAQPFISAGQYTDFRTVRDPRNPDFDQRFHTFSPQEISTEARPDGSRIHRVDLTGDGTPDFSFVDPSFNRRHLRSNSVLRWEYRPGSSLFLVWSQNRSGFDPDGSLRFIRDAGELFGSPGTNVLLIKVSHWFGL